MYEVIGFGLIGCGVISRTHIAQIASIPDAKLVAVCDEVYDRAKKTGEETGVAFYTDVAEMLKRDDLDVVCIGTPSGLHAEVGVLAAQAGKHVVVEKPIDVTVENAERLIAACRENGVKLSVISQHRFDASTIRVKDELEKGRLGKLVLCEAAVNWYRSQAYYDSGDWRGTWALDGGGALMNQGIHTVDLMQYLMGPVESVFAHTGTLAHERIEVEDVAAATIRFQSGALGTLVGTTAAFPGYSVRIEVFGTQGSAVIDHDKLTHLYERNPSIPEESDSEAKVNLALAETGDAATGAADPGAISGSPHRTQLLDMMAAIRENREPAINGEEGLKPLRVILAVYESARTGKPVYLS